MFTAAVFVVLFAGPLAVGQTPGPPGPSAGDLVRVHRQWQQRIFHEGRHQLWQVIVLSNRLTTYEIKLNSEIHGGRLVNTAVGIDNPNQSFFTNGFMRLRIDGVYVDTFPVAVTRREAGRRGCLELMYDRPAGAVRTRLVLLPDDEYLYVEWAIDGSPGQDIHLELVCLPAVLNAQFQLGGRRAVRTVRRMIPEGQTAAVDPVEEHWAILMDQVYDLTDPTKRHAPVRGGVTGPASVVFPPMPALRLQYRVTADDVRVLATYPAGSRLLRLAVGEHRTLGNEEAFQAVRQAVGPILGRLDKLVSVPLEVVECTPARARATAAAAIQKLARKNESPAEAVENRIRDLAAARQAWGRQRPTAPVAADRRLEEAFEALAYELARLERAGRPGGRILEVRGLFNVLFGMAEAARRWPMLLAEVKPAYLRKDYNYGFYVDDFPATQPAIAAFDAIVLLDVDVEALGTEGIDLMGRYLKAGGGLVMLGGYYSYGLSGAAQTPLADLLPVRFKPFDLQPLDQALAPVRPDSALTAGLRWESRPYSLWQHQVVAAPEAVVHVTAGPHPFLVTGRVGSGRVAAFTGTVLGTPGPGVTPFWTWPSWPDLLARAIAWAADRPLK